MSRLQIFLRLCLIMAISFFSLPSQYAEANGTITSVKDTLTNNHVDTISSHTIDFIPVTNRSIQQISFQFSTSSGGSTKPSGLNLSNASLGALTNLNPSWTLDTTNASSGLLELTTASAQTLNTTIHYSAEFQNITNSSLGDCEPSSMTLGDMCYVTVTTYHNIGSAEVDTGTTTYLVIKDPSLTFTVEAVAAGETHNGVTTTAESTPTSLTFGSISPGSVGYTAHKITVTSNAPHGYTVYAYLTDSIKGTYVNGVISPFGAVNATWSTPQVWATPDGTVANDNTGWFGANTSDTRVSGWSSGSAKFGPISTTPEPVAHSNVADPSGTAVYVTYGLGVNSAQPSDTYTGNIMYDVQASY